MRGSYKGGRVKVRGDYFYQVRRERKDGYLVKKAFDPHGIECFSHIKKNSASEPLLAKNSFDPFN